MEEKKKGMSQILIIILTIIGICLVGFCAWYGVNYFKGENKLNNSGASEVEDNSHDVINEPENYIKNAELEAEFSKIHKFAYDYFLSWPYCGESEIVNGDELLRVSKQFKTYNELLNYLNKYMSEAVIKQSSFSDEENYYEKDGKLYCKTDAKGWSYEYESSKVNITNLTNNKAETKITIRSVNESYGLLEYFDVTFEKINDVWVITKYNKSGEDYEK